MQFSAIKKLLCETLYENLNFAMAVSYSGELREIFSWEVCFEMQFPNSVATSLTMEMFY